MLDIKVGGMYYSSYYNKTIVVTNVDDESVRYNYINGGSDWNGINTFRDRFKKLTYKKFIINNLSIDYLAIPSSTELVFNFSTANKSYSFKMSYIGEPEDFVMINKTLIANKIDAMIQQDINQLLKDFKSDMKDFAKECSDYKSEYTSPLILAGIMEVFKESAIEIADAFKEPSIKNTLLKLFNKQ